MNTIYDIAIIGAGAMGSAAAYHLSKTGNKILVIDRFNPPHEFGSSHGQSRIIREAYFESPVYVPLVQQAYHLWHQLEEESGKQLLLMTGGLMLGMPDSKVVQGAMQSAKEYHLPYEYANDNEIKKRFPAFLPNENTVGVFEKNAGILFPEECIRTNIQLAQRGSVDFRFEEIVSSVHKNGREVEITTNKEKYTAAKLIAATGAWLNELMPGLNLPLTVTRQVLFWFKVNEQERKNFLPGSFPIYIWQEREDKIFYGFPDLGDGIKIAIHYGGRVTNATSIDRNVCPEEIEEMSMLIQQHFQTTPTFNYSAVCMYTNTPDENFIIDRHPEYHNIIIASPCSGHGFKFSSAIGKLLCEMALDESTDFDISLFNLSRFRK